MSKGYPVDEKTKSRIDSLLLNTDMSMRALSERFGVCYTVIQNRAAALNLVTVRTAAHLGMSLRKSRSE